MAVWQSFDFERERRVVRSGSGLAFLILKMAMSQSQFSASANRGRNKTQTASVGKCASGDSIPVPTASITLLARACSVPQPKNVAPFPILGASLRSEHRGTLDESLSHENRP